MVAPDDPTPHDGRMPVIDYRGPQEVGEPLAPRAAAVRTAAWAMAVVWPIVAMVAGTASDRIRIPLPKKIALTVGAAAICALLFASPGKPRVGCATAFLFVGLWLVFVMWFWN